MDIRKKLIEMLGTESETTWTEFMSFLEQYLPFLSSKGRPTKLQIKESMIGKAGFSSFQDMCNAPVNEKGIGWNYNTYRLWKKSWNIVKDHVYLFGTNLSASEINSIYLDCIKRDIEFPNSLEELDSYNRSSKSAVKELTAKTNAANIKELLDAKAQITLLKEQIVDNTNLKLENATLRAKNESLEQICAESKVSAEKLEAALREQIKILEMKQKGKEALSKKLNAYKNMPLWKRVFNYTV